jgi:hypothetical protein
MKTRSRSRPLPVVGWREWVALPELGVRSVKAKIDTGARSSSLHVFDLETFRRRGKEFVRFGIHPLQRNHRKTVWAEVEVLERRRVRSSSGHTTMRPVIRTEVRLLGETWPIEVTLANRDSMGFRMLLGRQAVRDRYLVDAGRSFYGGRPRRKKKARKKPESKVKAGRKAAPGR